MRPGAWSHLTDDAVVSDKGTTLHRVVVGTVAAGQTATIHDCATTGAASAGNTVSVIDLDQWGTYEFGCGMGRGIVVITSGGTPDITVVYG